MVNENKLKKLEGVDQMHSLLHLDASQNALKNADFLSAPLSLSHLQEANLSQNKIRELQTLVLPRLKRLNLDENKLKSVEAFAGHRQLETLKLAKNKIKSMAGLDDMVRLKELYLGENKIKTWESLSGLPSLQLLDLKLNLLKDIPESLPPLPKLGDLNLSGNKIAKMSYVSNLLQLPNLQSINLEGNPMEEEAGGDLRKAIIMKFCVFQSEDLIEYRRLLAKVNDAEFGQEERQTLLDDLIQAADEEKKRKEEEERERREREEEERRLKAEEEERVRLEEEERKRLEEEERLRLLEEQKLISDVQDAPKDADPADPQGGAEEQQADDGGDGSGDDM
jgi:hypothetical protein